MSRTLGDLRVLRTDDGEQRQPLAATAGRCGWVRWGS
jgi:hypothetical protein